MSSTTLVRYYERQSFKRNVAMAFVYLALIAGGVVILAPFIWMLSTAVKVPGTEFIYPPQLFTRPLRWNNFSDGWTALPFTRWFFNTSVITLLSVAGAVISSSLVAYGFARLEFPGRTILFVILLSTMMLPFHVRLIPMFITFRYLGWIDTYLPLVVPFYFGGVPFFIFLVRQFFLTIPLEMEDAAAIDGAGVFTSFLMIILPLSRPVLGVVGVFAFIRVWNDFLEPLIYIHSMEKMTLSLGLRFFQAQDFTDWTRLMAVSIIVLVPSVALFFVAQKYYIHGVVTTGIKG
ncbi:MAG: carbohydrate ABC transporter permease [Spirochaetaceae bacterium]|nr:carbohydrate ABC transporter permease [Spirochaetaceae bacterium]MDE0229870.1 carbohydrate ABC transporter permease [Spirochaetaceae bacterium]